MRMMYTGAVSTAGDSVISHAAAIRAAGEEMYTYLNNLRASGQLTGEGIEQELARSHARWDAACTQFAEAENRFGMTCKDAYDNMIATDIRCGGYFQV